MIFEQTGEFRFPKKGEWYLDILTIPVQAEFDFKNIKHYILIPVGKICFELLATCAGPCTCGGRRA